MWYVCEAFFSSRRWASPAVIFTVGMLASSCSLRIYTPRSRNISVTSTGINTCTSVSSSTGIVQSVYPSNGANWNDYVTWSQKGSGYTVFNQPDVACAGTESGYFGCIHGGETKKFVVSGCQTCSGLSASDSLGAFQWTCDASSGTATFYSRGLQTGKGLKNLVSSNAFLNNSINVSNSLTTLMSSLPAQWWSNTVGPLPSNSGSNPFLTLANPGQVYTLAASALTGGYFITGTNKISVVTLGSAVLGSSSYNTPWCVTNGADYAIICSSNSHFLWIEGQFNIADATQVSGETIDLISSSFVRIHGASLSNSGGSPNIDGIYAAIVGSSLFDSIQAYSNSASGLLIDTGSSGILVENSRFTNNMNGITDANGNANSFVSNISSNNSQRGLNISTATHDVIVGNTLTNHTWDISDNGFQNTYLANTVGSASAAGVILHPSPLQVSQNAFFNTASLGAGFVVSNSSQNLFYDTLATDNAAGTTEFLIGIGVEASNNNLFKGSFIVTSTGAFSCGVSASTSGNQLINNTCLYGAGLSAPTTGVSAAADYLGKVLVNDPVNLTTQTNATALYASVSDWLGFSNIFRGWGLGGAAAFGSNTLWGACQGGNTCQIYDYRLKASESDGIIRNHYGSFTNGVSCPVSINPNIASNVVTDLQTSPHTFLLSAVEVMDPTLNPNGNFNGLCEAGEVCIYTPNLGSYQGEGNYTTNTCNFISGSGFGSTTIYAYPTNGG